MSILLLPDTGPGIGLGHLARCRAIGSVFEQLGYEVGCVPCGDVESTLPVADGDPPYAVAVVDSYRLNEARERAFGMGLARRIIVLDDLADRRRHCDLLVNPSSTAHRQDYETLVEESCTVLCGPRFAPVHPAFRRSRVRSSATGKRPEKEVARVFLSFGGADAGALTAPCIAALRDEVDAIEIVVGSAAPSLHEIMAAADASRSGKARATVHVDAGPEAVAELMRTCDLAIGAGGSMTWERCSAGLPCLVSQVAENQASTVRAAVDAGAAIDCGRPEDGVERIMAAFESCRRAPDLLSAMSTAAAALCDGAGAFRIVAAVAGSEPLPAGGHVSLRPAAPEDAQWLFELQQVPAIRRFSRQTSAPSWSEHTAWLCSTLSGTQRNLFIIEHESASAGFIRLDRVAAEAGSRFEVSIGVDPSRHGQGIGRAALKIVRRLASSACLDAFVYEENVASRRTFEAAGYGLVAPNVFRSMPQ